MSEITVIVINGDKESVINVLKEAFNSKKIKKKKKELTLKQKKFIKDYLQNNKIFHYLLLQEKMKSMGLGRPANAILSPYLKSLGCRSKLSNLNYKPMNIWLTE